MVQNHHIWCKGSTILRQKLSLLRFIFQKELVHNEETDWYETNLPTIDASLITQGRKH